MPHYGSGVRAVVRSISSCFGEAPRTSAQLRFLRSDPSACIAKVQFSRLICGVGPAERTGKSVVTYCPGGSRFFRVCSCRFDLKPREIVVLSMDIMLSLGSLPVMRKFCAIARGYPRDSCDGCRLLIPRGGRRRASVIVP